MAFDDFRLFPQATIHIALLEGLYEVQFSQAMQDCAEDNTTSVNTLLTRLSLLKNDKPPVEFDLPCILGQYIIQVKDGSVFIEDEEGIIKSLR